MCVCMGGGEVEGVSPQKFSDSFLELGNRTGSKINTSCLDDII